MEISGLETGLADVNVSSGMLVCESFRENNQHLYLSRARKVIVPKNPLALAMGSFSDGQVMQIDQCLSCSRYEPIIGQTYDIVNEVGANLSSILDDCQAGYMNMEDYINFCRIEKMHTPKKEYKLNQSAVKSRRKDDKDFKDEWDNGITMQWNYVPVENQRPQINWRQDINSDDKSPAKLASFQLRNGVAGSDQTAQSSIDAGILNDSATSHLQYMQDILDGKITFKPTDNTKEDPTDKIKANIQKGFDRANSKKLKEAFENMRSAGYEQKLQEACSKYEFDPCFAFSLIALESKGIPSNPGAAKDMFGFPTTDNSSIDAQIEAGVKKIREIQDSCNCGSDILMVARAIDKWDSSFSSLEPKYNDKWYEAVNGKGDLTFEPAIVKAYDYVKNNIKSTSQLTSGESGSPEFPIKTEDLQYVTLVQDYGVTNTSQNNTAVAAVSNGMVFNTSKQIQVYSPFSGFVTSVENSGGTYTVIIKDSITSDTVSISGLSKTNLQKGDNVEKSNAIGTTDSKFILRCLDSENKIKDPKTVWPLLSGATTGQTLSNLVKSRSANKLA